MPRDQSNWFSNFVSMYLLSDYSLIQLCTMDRLKKTPLSRDRFELLRQRKQKHFNKLYDNLFECI